MSAPAAEGGDPAAGYVEVRHKALLTVATMVAMVMQILDSTIATVALPHIQSSLGASQETIGWVLTSYIIATAVTLPVLGWVTSRFGQRRVFLTSVVVFTAASALCGLSQSIGQLVVFRVLQGIGGAFIAPLAQTTMLDINRPENRARAMALFAQGIMLGPIAGPVIGGYLTENFDWRWVFFVNVPLGIAAVFVLFATLPRIAPKPRPFDLFGWVVIAAALTALQLLLDRGPTKDWFASPEVVVYAGIAVAASWMFVVHMVTKRDSLFPREVFRDRNLVIAVGFMFLIGVVMLSVLALMPSLLQAIYGYPAIVTGWLLTPRGFGVLVAMRISAWLMAKVDMRLLMGSGLAVTAFSLHMMSGWGPELPRDQIIVSGFVQGLGLGMAFTPMNIIAFATLPAAVRTDASSLMNLSRNLGASIGIATTSVLLARSIQVNHAEISANLTPGALPFDIDALRRYGEMADAGFAVLDVLVNRQAAMIGYINNFHAMSLACVAAIPAVLLLRRVRAPSTPPRAGD